jgi:hypothetical protein
LQTSEDSAGDGVATDPDSLEHTALKIIAIKNDAEQRYVRMMTTRPAANVDTCKKSCRIISWNWEKFRIGLQVKFLN